MFFSLALWLAVTVTAWADSAFSGGNGSEESPYQIASTTDLNQLATDVNGGNTYEGKFFKVTADIAYSHTSTWSNTSSTENNFTPIGGCPGGVSRYFYGTFDGNGYTISGIRIYKSGDGDADSYLGLFGYMGDGTGKGCVKNILLDDTRITGCYNVGGIAAICLSGAIIENCQVGSNVAIHAITNGAWNHGGIVGWNEGTVKDCISSVKITVKSGVTEWLHGAIVGKNDGTLIRNFYYNSNVNGQTSGIGTGAHDVSGVTHDLWGIEGRSADGSAAHPYIISTTDEFDWLAIRVNNGNTYNGIYFELGDDIAYAHETAWDNTTSTENNFTPIGGGANGKNFSGSFDGKNHTISGIRIYQPDEDRLGLFGSISSDNLEMSIQNIILADTRITSNELDVGGIVGINYCYTISNCHVTNSVALSNTNGCNYFGGIVGYNNGGSSNPSVVIGCTSAVKFIGSGNFISCGGIAGKNGENGELVCNFVTGVNFSNMLNGVIVGCNESTANEFSGYAGRAQQALNKYNIPGQSNSYRASGGLTCNYYANCSAKDKGSIKNKGIGKGGNIQTICDVEDCDGAVAGYYLMLDEGVTASKGTGYLVPAHKDLNSSGRLVDVPEKTFKLVGASQDYEMITIEFIGTPPTGYALDYLLVTYEGYEDEKSNRDEFEMPAKDVTVRTIWKTATGLNANDPVYPICEYAELTVPTFDYSRTLAAPDDAASADAVIDEIPVNVYTLCLPYNPPTGEGIKYYTLSGVTETSLQFEEITGAPVANMPYVVTVSASTSVGTTSQMTDVKLKKEVGAVTVGGYKFVGTTIGLENVEASDLGAYILQSGNTWGKVDVEHGSAYIPAFRAYIVATSASAPLRIDTDFEEGATGICNVTTDNGQQAKDMWYTLSGVKLNGKPTAKGVYIVNDKIVVIK